MLELQKLRWIKTHNKMRATGSTSVYVKIDTQNNCDKFAVKINDEFFNKGKNSINQTSKVTDLNILRVQGRVTFLQTLAVWFSCDVTAAILVYRTTAKKVLWDFDYIIMQNLSDVLPLFCTPTWPSHHVSENQE